MAKVTGPLMSMDASGQLGGAIVFSKWKGKNYVRQFIIPANPKSSGQGDNRILVGGTGRVAGKVTVAGAVNAELMSMGVIPAGQSKQSYLVKYILDHVLTAPSDLATIQTAYNAHSAKTTFDSEAAALGLVTFDLAYAAIAPFTAGQQLYVLAKALQAIGLTTAPFSTALASWSGANVTTFAGLL